MLIDYDAPWNRQPQEITGANPEFIDIGLIGLWNLANGMNATLGGNLAFATTPIDRSSSSNGIGYKNQSINSGYRLIMPDLSANIALTNEATLVLILGGGTTADQGLVNIGGANANFGDHYPYASKIYSGTFLTSSRWVSAANSIIDFAEPHVVGMQFRNGAQRYSQSGKTTATATQAVNPNWGSASTLLGSLNGAFGYSGVTLGAALFNKYLSNSDLFEITKSIQAPWKLFASQTTQVPISSGSPPPPSSLSQYYQNMIG